MSFTSAGDFPAVVVFIFSLCLASFISTFEKDVEAAREDHTPTRPSYIFLEKSEVKAVRQKIAAGEEPWKTAYDHLIRDAEEALHAAPRSVTDDDGSQRYVLNDDYRFDYTDVMISMTERIRDLGMAYVYTGDDRYAEAAIENIDYFLLNDTTGMEPNVIHGGNKSYYPEPHITIPAAIYGAAFLRGHSAWGNDGRPRESEMQDWVRQWQRSLVENTNDGGMTGTGGKGGNNIFAWYLFDRMVSEAYLGDEQALENSVARWKEEALDQAIAKEGGAALEHELARNSAYGYSMYGMLALTLGAEVAFRHGYDLFTVTNEAGLSLRDVYDWHAPYLDNPESWPYRQQRVSNPRTTGAVALEYANNRWNGEYISVIKPLRPIYDSRVMGWVTLTHGDLHSTK